MIRLSPGMRVVVRDGPWPIGMRHRGPKCAGHYGKVTAVCADDNGVRAQVDITGHIDGGQPLAIMQEIGRVDWFWTDELEVVD